MFTRSLCYICVAIALALGFLLIVDQSLGIVRAARQQPTTGNTYVVDSTADTVDADVGADPACADASGHCTLRAAILQANFASGWDTITLPAGVYVLTRSGVDDATQVGDLDIVDDLTIQGAGSSVTIIDGNGAATGDRVFQILSSAKNVTLSGLAIRNGKRVATFDEGGGLYWEGSGSHLSLNGVIFEGNTGYYGGGLYLNYSTQGDVVDLDHVVVHANTATAAAGGLGVNFDDFATFDLLNSQVYSNTAYEGGGVYFQGTPSFGLLSIRIDTSDIYSNTASLSGGIENRSGNATVPVMLMNSHLYDNHANFYGGAIGNYGTLVISNTTMSANSASITGTNAANTRGGGLYNYEGGQIDLEQSTLSGNSAASGGGIYSELFIHNGAALTLTNSTLSNNTASRDGGGLYAMGGQIKFLNATLADNAVAVPPGTSYAGLGGGVYLTGSAIVTTQNTLLASNTHRYGINSPVSDDCYTYFFTLRSLGFNLIQTLANCTLSGTTFGNITGQDPQLGPLQNNGGATLTRAPATSSPAIDHGDSATCPSIDQRGFRRPLDGNHDGTATCDIGAVEIGLPVYLPLLRR